MRNELIVATKQSMGFKENQVCGNCKYSVLEDDTYLNRCWHLKCTFSNVCHFVTNEKSSCKHFEQKTPNRIG